VLSMCCQHFNWSAAALIYDLLGEWVQAMGCRLRAIEHNARELAKEGSASGCTDESSEKKEIDSLFSLLLSLLRQKNNDKKAVLILQVLYYWQRRKLPIPPLESFLLDHIDEAGYNLAQILHSRSGYRNPFADLPFTARLYESIALLCMRKLNLTPDQSSGNEAIGRREGNGGGDKLAGDSTELSEEGLWGEITATLPSHWDKRGKVTLPMPSLLSPSSIGLEDQVIAFSCDEAHHWGRRGFYEGVMGKFKALLAALPRDLHMTGSLLLAEYQQGRIGLACPMCVYNTLRQELLPEYPSLKPWTDQTGRT